MMQTPVYYLIYVSLATGLMSEQQLVAMLEQARRNNLEMGITGMLLYMEGVFMAKTEGRFMQLLEGDRTEILSLYDRIAADERNHDALLLGTGYESVRCFPGWSMGFEVLDAAACKNMPAFYAMDNDFLKTETDQEALLPLSYLKSFYQVNKDL